MPHTDGDLMEMVGALLEVDETGTLATDRARRLVQLAEKSAIETPTRCAITAEVDEQTQRCTSPTHKGPCTFRTSGSQAGGKKPAGGSLGSLDDLLEWTPDPGAVRAEILGILAKLPDLAELDRVAELVGKLAAMVDAPAGIT